MLCDVRVPQAEGGHWVLVLTANDAEAAVRQAQVILLEYREDLVAVPSDFLNRFQVSVR